MASLERRDELDFTEASLIMIEEMLAEAVAYRNEASEYELRKIIEGVGCYILEVARRTYGGRYLWHDAQEEPVLVVGEPEARVALTSWSRVAGRLTGDAADKIPFYFEGFSLRARARKPGDDVLFV